MTRRAPIIPASERVVAYDALRVFAILSVVAVHCFMPLRGVLPPLSPALVIDDLLHYAVPLFVFISGALVWGRPYRCDFVTFLRTRFTSVGLPYLAWAMGFLILLGMTSPAGTPTPGRAFGLLITGHVWYHLYFIPMLVGFYLLTPIASRLIRRWPEATLLAVYSLRILAWPPLAAWLKEAAPDLAWSYATHIATHLPHMALGAWFMVRRNRLPECFTRLWPVLLLTGMGTLFARIMGEVPNGWRSAAYALGMAASVMGIAMGAFRIQARLERARSALTTLASLSLGVYFVHPIWLLALERSVTRFESDHLWLEWWAVPSAWLIITAASLATSWLLTRSEGTSWLAGQFGNPRR